jgi:hypothetical protein
MIGGQGTSSVGRPAVDDEDFDDRRMGLAVDGYQTAINVRLLIEDRDGDGD